MHRLMRFWRVRFRALRAPAASALRRGQRERPFLRNGALPPLRSGQVSLDEAEHFPAQSRSQRRYAPMVFGIIPECRSASLRNERSASPESAIDKSSRLAATRPLGPDSRLLSNPRSSNHFASKPLTRRQVVLHTEACVLTNKSKPREPMESSRKESRVRPPDLRPRKKRPYGTNPRTTSGSTPSRVGDRPKTHLEFA